MILRKIKYQCNIKVVLLQHRKSVLVIERISTEANECAY